MKCYMGCCVFNLAPLALPHTATRDTIIGGYTVPKDSWIIPNLYACHHDHDVWGDPDNFRPERWIDEHGALRKYKEYIPFSIGRLIESVKTTCTEKKIRVQESVMISYTYEFEII